MATISFKAPASLDKLDGLTMLSSIAPTLKQNLKMLLLTMPGERVMTPDFGCGLKRFLFEMRASPHLVSDIEQTIREQVAAYMPVIRIDRIIFDDFSGDENALSVSIWYSVPSLAISDSIITTI